MIFNSLEFGLFILLVLTGYSLIYRKDRSRDLFLLAVSYFFYSAWYWEYAGLIVISTLADWIIAQAMARTAEQRARRRWLILSLSINLGLLGFFKYANFFADAAEQGLRLFGLDVSLLHHELLLPVGISFYTFQTLSYTIDVYRKDLTPEPSLLKFAVFVSFFPQLVAGPIVRAASFLPQLRSAIKVDRIALTFGAFLVASGLFKKVVVADSLALLGVDTVFGNPAGYSPLDLWAALYGYAFQIYCDFSGYSDIAIGLALMMGFSLPINFNRPYLATDPSDFWKRWHISLSSWLRDYLYVSLGGNRGGSLFTARNLLLTMLLGGLWHGASWTFIVWGLMHGLYLIAYRPFRARTATTSIGRLVAITLTFHLIVLTWLPFRSPDMSVATSYFLGMLGVGDIQPSEPALSAAFYGLVIGAAILHFLPESVLKDPLRDRFLKVPLAVQGAVYAAILVILWGFSVDAPQFIYFQF